jgi:threonine/homoserine/homoserine lactone efflux protein
LSGALGWVLQSVQWCSINSALQTSSFVNPKPTLMLVTFLSSAISTSSLHNVTSHWLNMLGLNYSETLIFSVRNIWVTYPWLEALLKRVRILNHGTKWTMVPSFGLAGLPKETNKAPLEAAAATKDK